MFLVYDQNVLVCDEILLAKKKKSKIKKQISENSLSGLFKVKAN